MDLFEFGAGFDWISATRALCETLRHGPFNGHTFYIDLDSGWAGAECEDILTRHGIGIYARCIAEDDAFFTVSNEQAETAEALLLQAGVPLKYHLFSEWNRKYLGGRYGT